jgi:hypothetical protein
MHLRTGQAILAAAGIVIVAIVALAIVPKLSGRYDLFVAYGGSVQGLQVQNQTLLEKWGNEAMPMDDNQLYGLPKLGELIANAKEHSDDDIGGTTPSTTINGFEYSSLNSRLDDRLDKGGTMILYNNDFYIIGVIKY